MESADAPGVGMDQNVTFLVHLERLAPIAHMNATVTTMLPATLWMEGASVSLDSLAQDAKSFVPKATGVKTATERASVKAPTLYATRSKVVFVDLVT